MTDETMVEPHYQKQEREAAERVANALALPVPECRDDLGSLEHFDPWEMFPCFYGSYSSAFDEMALTVLRHMRDKVFVTEDLAHEMFREHLCRVGLCDYGTSPRGCFPSNAFKPLLPQLIDRWEAYSLVAWGEE